MCVTWSPVIIAHYTKNCFSLMAFGRTEPREWLFGGKWKIYAMDLTGMIVTQSIVSSSELEFKEHGSEVPPSTSKSLAGGHWFWTVVSLTILPPCSDNHDMVGVKMSCWSLPCLLVRASVLSFSYLKGHMQFRSEQKLSSNVPGRPQMLLQQRPQTQAGGLFRVRGFDFASQ